ncbi:MAG: DUF6745 domain-containing protein [Flavobacteriales bacterium]
MKIINALTKKQEGKIAEYRDEWIARGLTTERKTLKEARKVFATFQEVVLNKTPVPVVLLDSPTDCWAAVLNAFNAPKNTDFVYPYFDCQYWAGFFAFYEFIKNELGIKYSNDKEYSAMLDCSSFGMVWPTDKICVVCQPPTIIKKNPAGLHCEDGPAISYNGKNDIYALNGVVVPKELVMTASEDLSMDFFKSQTNADVKAEFVRKYGVERMLDLGKMVDSYTNYDYIENEWWHRSEYELHDMGVLFGLNYQPYLKMKNQTTGIWHVEAVSPNCRTLKDAIKERFGGREMKIVAIA